MKRFIVSLVYFLLGWLFVSTIADYSITRYIRTLPTRNVTLWNELLSSNINVNMVYIGSSRAMNSYNTQVIDSILGIKSYNLGMMAQFHDYNYFMYDILKQYNRKPKYVVWDVFYRTLDETGPWCDFQFTPFVNNTELYCKLNDYQSTISFFDKTIPLYRYYKYSIFDFPIKWFSKDSCFHNGFVPNNNKWDDNNLKQLDEEEIKSSFSEKGIDFMHKAIQNMKSEGTTVILVYSPFHKKGRDKVENFDKMANTFQNIADKEEIVFLNFLNDSINNDTTYFVGAVHLNGKGADCFSRKVAQSLIPIVK